MTMTSALGHLTGLDFHPQYKHWRSCPPGQLFDAPVFEEVASVGRCINACVYFANGS